MHLLFYLGATAAATRTIRGDATLQAGSKPTISRYNLPYIATKAYTCVSAPSVIDNLYVVLNSDERTCEELSAFGWRGSAGL